MVELFEKNIVETENRSSKGNQLKWMVGDYWYKADYAGYEGLSEYIASKMLECSDLDSTEYVKYELVKIQYKRSLFNGCRSKNFLKNGQQLITLERLYKNFTGESLYQKIYHIEAAELRLSFLCEQIERITGITGFATYLNKVFSIDAITLNEDRHLHNIAVILNNDGTYELCPIFDQGAGLLSDTTMDYPMEEDIYELMETVKSKTFVSDFDEQLDQVEALAGINIHFHFTKKDVTDWLSEESVKENYSEEIIQRVEKIVFEKMRKYKYLFS